LPAKSIAQSHCDDDIRLEDQEIAAFYGAKMFITAFTQHQNCKHFYRPAYTSVCAGFGGKYDLEIMKEMYPWMSGYWGL
jgi:hypothetical protein